MTKRLNSTPPTRIKYLSKQEIEGFFLCIKNPRDKALFGIIYLYGLRASEAILLMLSDLDPGKRRIFIRRIKGGISGERPLFGVAERLLRGYLKVRLETGHGLFTGRQGNLTRQRVYQLFKRYAEKAGIGPEYSVHCLRHSIATHLLEAGEGVEFIRDHLGHRNIQNTMIYAQITDSRREETYRRVEGSSKIARIKL